jgi:hypothetical protein
MKGRNMILDIDQDEAAQAYAYHLVGATLRRCLLGLAAVFLMLAIAALAEARAPAQTPIQPPTKDGPYLWCVETFKDWVVVESACTQPGDAPTIVVEGNAGTRPPKTIEAPKTASAVRTVMRAQALRAGMPVAHVDAWLKSLKITTPGTGANLPYYLPYTRGTFVRAVVENVARRFPPFD